MTRLAEFQTHIAELYLAKDRRRGTTGTMLWMVEEVGELAEAVRRAEAAGIGSALPDGAGRGEREGLEEEMADVLAWLASLANLLDVDLERAVAAKYPAQCKRCGQKPCACPEPVARPL